jgi:hypothetical protein
MTYALRGACSPAAHALAAPMSRGIALIALGALGLSGDPVHEPVHAPELYPRVVCDVARLPERLDSSSQHGRVPSVCPGPRSRCRAKILREGLTCCSTLGAHAQSTDLSPHGPGVLLAGAARAQ